MITRITEGEHKSKPVSRARSTSTTDPEHVKAMDGRVRKAYDAARDALEHLSRPGAYTRLEFSHIDRMLARIVDPPTDAKQKNNRRGIAMVKRWMLEDGAAVILLETFGQLCWRFVDLSAEQIAAFRRGLYLLPEYRTLLRDSRLSAAVVARLWKIRENKARACSEFVKDLEGSNFPTPSSSVTVY